MEWVSLVIPPGGEDAWPGPDSLWWGVQGSRVLVGPEATLPVGPSPEDAGFVSDDDDLEPIFLGILAGQECWAVSVGRAHGTPPGFELHDLRMLFPTLGEQRWSIAGRAVQLVDWHLTHRFCGRCATPTEPSPGERARKCPRCGLLGYPRLAPAIITLVTRGDEALLARGVTFGAAPMYSCLAGFVEPGETLEECVAREIREEVGIELKDIQYQASQPWPFPHSLMLGFRAEWAANELKPDPSEIVDANWYRRDALPMIPPGVSIARKLIDAWVAEG